MFSTNFPLDSSNVSKRRVSLLLCCDTNRDVIRSNAFSSVPFSASFARMDDDIIKIFGISVDKNSIRCSEVILLIFHGFDSTSNGAMIQNLTDIIH